MEKKFDWYEHLENSDEITQGDILINFPFVRVKNYEELVSPVGDIELNVEIEYQDCIVLTQSCDIANQKPDMENIILCPIIDVKNVNFRKSKIGSCIKGDLPQYYMLNKCEGFANNYMPDGFNYHIVNFNVIEKAPIVALKEFAKKNPNRLRLLPPYREHLSQAFAKYFMRIGLPSDINKENVYEIMGLK